MRIILLLAAAAVLAYLFAVCPSLRLKKRARMPSGLYAHRGCYDNGTGIPENSMAAFRAAAARGVGIALDVRRTLDGKVVVFHDRSALRMCGEELTIDSHTWEELSHLRLLHTREPIPLLADVLKEIDAPLLINIMPVIGTKNRKSLIAKTARCVYRQVSGREQSVILQSASPRILHWFRFRAPDFLRGQVIPEKPSRFSLSSFLLRQNLFHFLSRPDFITMNFRHSESLGTFLCDRLLRIPMIARTVQNQSQLEYCLRTGYNIQVFEGFSPDLKP